MHRKIHAAICMTANSDEYLCILVIRICILGLVCACMRKARNEQKLNNGILVPGLLYNLHARKLFGRALANEIKLGRSPYAVQLCSSPTVCTCQAQSRRGHTASGISNSRLNPQQLLCQHGVVSLCTWQFCFRARPRPRSSPCPCRHPLQILH